MCPKRLAAVPATPLDRCWWLLALATGVPQGAQAQQPGEVSGEQAEVQLEAVTITGKRASLATVQQVRRQSLGIVDSVAAEDIVKLPDFSVTDALQRVTGVQIARDRGEGANVAIRGLTQVEALLNGREIFTAGTGRTLDFSDFASEMVSRIDVYKTSSADHIEGGLGGMIDVRTRRPFDFEGHELLGSVRVVHGDLVKAEKPQVSLLASGRWKTAGGGEFGALANLVVQERAWREDLKATGNPVEHRAPNPGEMRTDNSLVPGQTIIAPSGTSETTSFGHRKRTGGHLVLQWRPVEEVELHAEASHVELRTVQDSHQINVTTQDLGLNNFVPGSLRLFPGSQDLQSITWTSAPLSVLSFARDTVDRTSQLALGGKWSRDALTISGDWSRTKSFNHLFFSGPFLAGTAANFAQDLSTRLPGTSISGTNLLDPANLTFTGIAFRTRPFHGTLNATRLDVEYKTGHEVFQALHAGVRQATRRANNLPGQIFADASVSGLTAADRPGFVMPNPYVLFPGKDEPSVRDFLIGNLEGARDAPSYRAAFGITTPIPTSGPPLSLWTLEEETNAGYVMGRFRAEALGLDGNAGLRVVRTHTGVSGSQSVPSTGGIAPIDIDAKTTDWLPSVNLRFALGAGWQVRAAASKTLTRPDFNQLSPSLNLSPNPINPALNVGAAGNPSLQAIRSRNLDLAVERYFNRTTFGSVTAFVKKVDGFIANVSQPEVHDGAVFSVTRPQNTNPADIKGVELGYQQFYDFLPGWLGGLGAQANYTYVDSKAPLVAGGEAFPLPNLSRHSVNLIGMYERGRVSGRLAYNWRDRFVSGFFANQPIYTRAYGWLDASVSYRLTDRVAVAVEGTNLLRTMRSGYYGNANHPQSNLLNDRQISLLVSLRM